MYDELKAVIRQVSSFLIDLLSTEFPISHVSASNLNLNELSMINCSYGKKIKIDLIFFHSVIKFVFVIVNNLNNFMLFINHFRSQTKNI